MSEIQKVAVKGRDGYAYDIIVGEKNEGGTAAFSSQASAEEFIALFESLPSAHGQGIQALYSAVSSPGSSLSCQKQAFVDALLNGQVRIHQHPVPKIIPETAPTLPPSKSIVSETKTQGGTTDETTNAVDQSCSGSIDPCVDAENNVLVGDPIAMSNGEEVLQLNDLKLEGEVDLIWQRLYRSSLCHQDVGMGLGWRSNFHFLLELQQEEGGRHWLFTDAQGRQLRFEYGGVGSNSQQVRAGMVLHHQDLVQVNIAEQGGRVLYFTQVDGTWFIQKIGMGGHHHYRLEYSAAHRLIKITANVGLGFCLRYNLQGQLIEVCSSRAQDAIIYMRYEYDEQGHLISAASRGQQAERYRYQQGLLLQRTRPAGFNHHFRWQGDDNRARCVAQWGDDNIYSYQFSYDEQGRSTSSNSLQQCWHYQHDANGQLISKTAPGGECWEYKYDSLQRCIRKTNPSGSVSQTRYNARGQISAEIDALGNVTRFHYNRLGQVIQVTHPDGSKHKRNYSSLGLLMSEQLPAGGGSHYHYDKRSRLCKVTSSQEPDLQYWWNEQDQLLAEQSGAKLTRYSYNKHGERDGEADSNGKVIQYHYHENGSISQQIEYNQEQSEDQQQQRYHYDDAGRLTAYSDSLGRTTRFQYQRLTQPHQQTNPDGSWLRFEYDFERKLTGIERSDGCRYQLNYNDLEQISQTIGFDGRVQDYRYNPDGQLEQLCENSERYIRLKRDLVGRIVERRSMGMDKVMQCDHYCYDSMGRIIEANNVRRSVFQSYHSNGELRQESQGEYVIEHQLNEQGQRSLTRLPDGTTIGYQYNFDGELSHLHVNGEQVVERVFADNGHETGRFFPQAQMCQQWNSRGKLGQQQWFAKDYDQQRNYAYDQGNQLQQVTDSKLGNAHYNYDEQGQLKEQQLNSFANPSHGEHQDDRLGAHKDCSYSYDPFGNQISSVEKQGRQHRVFNGLNQLVRLNCQNHSSQYHYDAFGRRCAKLTEQGQTDFIWDKQRLLGEYHNGQYRWYIYEPKTHRPLIMIEDGVVYAYQCDHLGTPIGLFDSEGEVVWQASYHPYGKIKEQKQARIDNPLRFQGQYFDEESSLHYNHHRYYCPEQGRYIQQDPIGLAGGLNPYRYTRNPLSQVDPLGLECAEGCQIDLNDEDPVIVALLSKKLAALNPIVDFTQNPAAEKIPFENSGGEAEEGDKVCSFTTFTLKCGHSERNYTYDAFAPEKDNTHKRIAVVGEDTITVKTDADCKDGLTQKCAAISVIGHGVDTIENGAEFSFDVQPPTSDSKIVSLKDFFKAIIDGFDCKNVYKLQAKSCDASLTSKAEVWAFDSFECSGEMALAYSDTNFEGKKRWQIESTLKGKKGAAEWSLGGASADNGFVSILNKIDGVIDQIKDIAGKADGGHGYKTLSSGFIPPNVSIGGSLQMVEVEASPEVGLKGHLDIEFKPLLGFKLTLDVVTMVIKKVFPGPLADPILSARKSAEKGIKSENGKVGAKAKVVIDLILSGRIDGQFAWDLNPGKKCLPTKGADASKASAEIGLILKAETTVEVEMFWVKFQIGSKIEVVGEKSKGVKTEATAVGLCFTAYATEINGKPALAGSGEFTGLKLVASSHVKIQAKTSDNSDKETTGSQGGRFGTKKSVKAGCEASGEAVILKQVTLFDTGVSKQDESTEKVAQPEALDKISLFDPAEEEKES
jgi:RHS repeat-associated protein